MPKGCILTVVPASLELVLASDPLHCSSAAQAVQAKLQMQLCAALPEHFSTMQDVLMSVNMLPCPLDHELHLVLLLAAG